MPRLRRPGRPSRRLRRRFTAPAPLGWPASRSLGEGWRPHPPSPGLRRTGGDWLAALGLRPRLRRAPLRSPGGSLRRTPRAGRGRTGSGRFTFPSGRRPRRQTERKPKELSDRRSQASRAAPPVQTETRNGLTPSGRSSPSGQRPDAVVARERNCASFANSSAPRARLKTATPPIQPVKPTPRELWITRPMVKGPPVPSFAGV